MKNVFYLNTNIPCNFRSRSELYCRNPKTVNYGTETISYLGPRIWFLVPEARKSSKSLDAFKSKISQWESDCPFRLWKTYFFITYFFKSTTNIMYLIRFEPMLLSSLMFFVFLQLT